MRTTLNLNDDLVRRAREAAARERTTLTRLIEEGLRLRLRPPEPPEASRAPLPVFHGGTGLAAGLDPLRSMLDAADAAEGDGAPR